jgi:hypothetical protein
MSHWDHLLQRNRENPPVLKNPQQIHYELARAGFEFVVLDTKGRIGMSREARDKIKKKIESTS